MELSQTERRYLLAAFSHASNQNVTFRWRAIGSEVGLSDVDTASVVDGLESKDLISRTVTTRSGTSTRREFKGGLTPDNDNAGWWRPAGWNWCLAAKAGEPDPPFTGQHKHYFVLVLERQPDAGEWYGHSELARRTGCDYQTGEDLLHWLEREGYLEADRMGAREARLHPRGRRVAERFAADGAATRDRADDSLSQSWTTYQQEAEAFLLWAWRECKGDRNVLVDARTYGLKAMKTKHDVLSVVGWLSEPDHGFVEEPESEATANAHTRDYWRVPVNDVLPHSLNVQITTKGVAEIERLKTAKAKSTKLRAAVESWWYKEVVKPLAIFAGGMALGRLGCTTPTPHPLANPTTVTTNPK